MGEKILYLAKISKKEFLEGTCTNGRIYMNTCERFRIMAAEEGGDLVGDLHECSFPAGTEISFGNITMKSFDEEDEEVNAMCCAANYCVYCTYAIIADSLPNEGVISSEVFQGIVGENDPSEYAVLLFKQPYTLVRKVVTALSNRGLEGRCDLIAYDDHEFVSTYRFGSKEYILDLCFHKRSKYRNQKEYRIATINAKNEAIEDLYIGRLEEDEYEMIPIQMNKDLHIITGTDSTDVSYKWQ
ncbi:MAG: hypothetical protein ACI4NF_00620 [Christensenellales bacterium]